MAALVAQGCANREIGERLFLSPRTVETHVQHLMDKLGVGSRAEIAAWHAREVAGTHVGVGRLRGSRRLTRLFRRGPFAALRHGDEHVAALVSVVDVPVCLDDVVQRIPSVNHGPDLTLRGQLAEQHQVFATNLSGPEVKGSLDSGLI